MACSENEPIIPPLGPQELGERNVIIEEFTGVRCPNCPDGAAEIENLKVRFGKNLIAVSIHSSGNFAIPLPQSAYDFRTDAGDDLLELLGRPLGYPAAVVNRTPPQNSMRLQQGQTAWAGLIQRALEEAPSMALNVTGQYNDANRLLKVNVNVLANRSVNRPVNLSVMLLENKVVDAQLDFNGLIEDYEHNHVLRFMLTPSGGLSLGDNLTLGQFIERNFEFTIPLTWVATNCEIVAFAHFVGEDKAVLQAELWTLSE
ncbi:MAG: Omp28-related outer membrane protein [Saprospiraceae bacterium]|nr:Omp28-related outer membrane protein [Saprospiraceae bacterium]